MSIVGPDAAAKAERTGEALIERARRISATNSCRIFPRRISRHWAPKHPTDLIRARARAEVLLRLVVAHPDARCLELFARELGSVGISFAPGTTGIYTGRPKPTPLIRLYTFYVDKTRLPPPKVALREALSESAGTEYEVSHSRRSADAAHRAAGTRDPAAAVRQRCGPRGAPTMEVPLIRLALARSGDKGDSSKSR